MMASNFRSVNAATPTKTTTPTTTTSPFQDNNKHDEEVRVKSPTTPRPSTAPHHLLSHPPPPQTQTMDDATTPTRATFGNQQQQALNHNPNSSMETPTNQQGMAQQKPLPDSPFPDAAKTSDESTAAAAADSKKRHRRANSQQSKRSRDSAEMDVDDSDNEDGGEDDGAGSDGEGSVNGDGSRSSKKKKGNQRFYCKDYPPCNLSFTRSEHLARHIRKHTGERPFQCHCQRRFSRLDNLRQHAQTVHINEDIPFDSLAATGTRFQRQIRTDRVQRGGRARASTAGSVGAPPRGHSKSLSTSSIASISSIGSNYSSRDDIRRRPPPLVMADPSARLSVESYRSVGSAQYPYRGASPSDYSTPTSATFSTGQSSPRWGSGVGSPATSYSRAHGMYPSGSGSRTPGRRLSVPSGGNPFQSPHGAGNLGRPLFGAGSMNASNSAALASPGGSYMGGSPTTSTAGGWHARRDSASSAAEEAWRRRTWHPDSSNFTAPNSRLSQVITSSQLSNAGPEPLPALNQPHQNNHSQQQQPVRLPGIDSLLPKSGPPPRVPSPMMIDGSADRGAPLLPSASISSEDSRAMQHWDMGLHRGLTRLAINNSSNTTPPPRDGAGMWANEVQLAMQARVEQPPAPPPTRPYVRFEPEPQVVHPPPPQRHHQHTMSAPVREKRHGWYNGPVTVHEDRVLENGSGSRPPHVDRIAHPNLHSFGFPSRIEERREPREGVVVQGPGESRAFEALLAVAERESSARAATAC